MGKRGLSGEYSVGPRFMFHVTGEQNIYDVREIIYSLGYYEGEDNLNVKPVVISGCCLSNFY